MDTTKTTFHLPDSIRVRLKALAAHRGTTVTELLTEGARMVLARHQRSADAEELGRRARAARLRLRRGLYSGPAIADVADDLIYQSPQRQRKAR